MTETKNETQRAATAPGTAAGGLDELARDASTVARERAGELQDAARSTVDDARNAAEEHAEAAKGQAASEIDRTAASLEAVADDLDGEGGLQQELLREAADGLKQISRSIEGKSVGAMVEDLSEFGRNNPLAYLGGAALAGFALARFALASSHASRATTEGGYGQSPRGAAAPTDYIGSPAKPTPYPASDTNAVGGTTDV